MSECSLGVKILRLNISMSKSMKTPDAPVIEPASEPVELERPTELPEEIGGRAGLDPTRYGDWEKNGRCIDF